jgi:hypothetical protein
MRKIILSGICVFSVLVFSSSVTIKSPRFEFSDQPFLEKKTYAALFASANGLQGTDIDIDRMKSLLEEVGVSAIVYDKTTTVRDILTLSARQARQAEHDNADLFLFFSGHGKPYNVVLDDAYLPTVRWLRYIDNSISSDINIVIFLDTCYAASIVEIIKSLEFKHIRNVKVAASSEAGSVSPDFGSVFGGAFTGAFYMAFKTFKMRNPFGIPTWGDVSSGVYSIYRFVAPNTSPVFLDIDVRV